MERFIQEKNPGDAVENEKKRILVEVGCGINPFFIKSNKKIAPNEHYIGIDLFPPSDQLTDDWPDPQETKSRLASSGLVEGDANIVSASGNKLPFRDNSVDELIIKDVLGSPLISAETFEKEDAFDESDEEHVAVGKKILSEKIGDRLWEEKKKRLYRNELLTKSYGELDKRIQRLIRHYYCMSLKGEGGTKENEIKLDFLDEALRVLKNGGKLSIVETRTPDIATKYIDKLRGDKRLILVDSELDVDDFVNQEVESNKHRISISFRKNIPNNNI